MIYKNKKEKINWQPFHMRPLIQVPVSLGLRSRQPATGQPPRGSPRSPPCTAPHRPLRLPAQVIRGAHSAPTDTEQRTPGDSLGLWPLGQLLLSLSVASLALGEALWTRLGAGLARTGYCADGLGSGLSHSFLSDQPAPLTEPYQKLDTSGAKCPELSLEGEPVEGPEETQGMEEIEAS